MLDSLVQVREGGDCISSLKALGISGTGGLGILAAAVFIANAMDSALVVLFGFALLVFVVAGAVALVARSV